MSLITSRRSGLLLLALVLAACHKAPPEAAAPLPVAVPDAAASSAIRLATLADRQRLSEEQRDFLDALQAVVLRENFRIEADRHRLLEVADIYLHDGDIEESDFNWLKNLADRYQLHPKSRSDRHFFDVMLERVDVVPPSLVLAHVAASAGWPDTSQDSLDTITFRQDICHGQFCVRRNGLPGLGDNEPPQGTARAISTYMLELNTDPDYSDFRALRADLRQSGQEPGGLDLAPSMHGKAEVSGLHVVDLEEMIRVNHLQDMD